MKKTRTGIDWNEIRRRLQANQEALERALTPDAGRLATVYRERAEHLFRRRVGAVETGACVSVLVFTLNSEHYALAVSEVLEIAPFARCTPVPSAPPELLGVVNLHGEIRSVVDLSGLVQSGSPAGSSGYVIFLRGSERLIGLRVDDVVRIQSLTLTQLTHPGSSEAGSGPRYVRAVTPGRLHLLDLGCLLRHPLFDLPTT